MADGMVPVAAMGNPIKSPNVFGQLSDILGIAQQRQQLQTQALLQQQEQIKTQAAQETSNFFQGLDPTQFIAPNGTTDINGVMSKDPRFAGLSGAGKVAVTEKLQAIQGKQIENMGAMATMNRETVRDFSQMMAANATRPEVQADTPEGRTLMQTAAQNFAMQGPQQAKIAGIYGKAFQNPQLGGAKQDHLSAAVAAIAAQAQTVSEQQAQSNPEDITNAQGQHINRARGTGALSEAPGSNDRINPTAPQVAEATRRTGGVATMDLERADQVSSQARDASAAIPQTQRIDDLADQIKSGKFAKWLVEKSAALGDESPSVTARQMLEKDLGQVKALATASAKTDEKMGTILSGFPEVTSNPNTIHGAMDYIRGKLRQDVSRSELLDRYRTKNPNLTGFQHADDILTKNAPPLMQEFKALKTSQEKAEFFKRNFKNREEAQEFRDRAAGVGHVIGQ